MPLFLLHWRDFDELPGKHNLITCGSMVEYIGRGFIGLPPDESFRIDRQTIGEMTEKTFRD